MPADIAEAINIDLEGKEAEGFSDTLVWPETGKYFTGYSPLSENQI